MSASIPDEIYTPDNQLAADVPNSQIAQLQSQPIRRDAHGRIIGGGKGSGSLNPGGRPKRVREFEKMLNKEHGNVDNLRIMFNRLRDLAMGIATPVVVTTPEGEMKLEAKLNADPAFMKLYLDRVIGPVKASNEFPIDLSNAPAEVIEFLRITLHNR